MHTTDTKEKIMAFIKENSQATNKQLRALTGITQVGISKHLGQLVAQGKIVRFGQHPRHSYLLSPPEAAPELPEVKPDFEKVAGSLKSKVAAEFLKLIPQIQQRKDISEEQKARFIADLERRFSNKDQPEA